MYLCTYTGIYTYFLISYICVIYKHIILYGYINTTNLLYTQIHLDELYFYPLTNKKIVIIHTPNSWAALSTTIHVVAAYPKARWTSRRKRRPKWDPGLIQGLTVTAAKWYTFIDYSFKVALQFFAELSQISVTLTLFCKWRNQDQKN